MWGLTPLCKTRTVGAGRGRAWYTGPKLVRGYRSESTLLDLRLVAVAALVLALSVWLPAVPAAAQAVTEKPTGLTATATAHNRVTLEWDDPADASITVYEILLRTPTTEGSGVLSVIATTIASHSPGSCWTRVLVMVPEKWTVDEGDDAVFRLRRFGNYITLPVNVEVAESNRDGSVLAPGERGLRAFTFEAVKVALAQARNAEVSAEELLVDDGWKAVEVEPKTIAVNCNGANGHHDADGIGLTVELVVSDNGHAANGNGHAPVAVNSPPRTGYGGNGANGHHDEAEEPQQTLFSWAEFMAEPVKPKARKAQAPSLLEWAVEWELEAEPIGAGR